MTTAETGTAPVDIALRRGLIGAGIALVTAACQPSSIPSPGPVTTRNCCADWRMMTTSASIPPRMLSQCVYTERATGTSISFADSRFKASAASGPHRRVILLTRARASG